MILTDYFRSNRDLTWERSQTLDVGLEFDFHKYLTAEIDYFNYLIA